MSKRAIILGGAGLIGSHLTIRLLSDGYDVVVIDKRERNESPLLRSVDNQGRFHYIQHDITKSAYNIGCDELYNLTAPIEYGSRFDYYDEQRLTSLGAINSLEAVVGNNTKVLYASSDDIYNFERLDTKYSSNKQLISEAKRFGESIHRAYHTYHNIDMRIARIFSTYGPNAGLRDQHVIGKMIVEALYNRNIAIHGSGEQIRTFCWAEDIVGGLIDLMNVHNSEGLLTCDLGSSHQITIVGLAELIVALTGSSSKIIHVAALPDEPTRKIPNTKQTKREIGWQATTGLKEGLQRTINYIEKELATITMSQMSWIEIYG